MDQSYRAALLQPAKQSGGTQQQITSFMRELTAEDLAEKEQRAHEEREAARDSNPAATKRAKVARAKPTGHENTTTISGAS